MSWFKTRAEVKNGLVYEEQRGTNGAAHTAPVSDPNGNYPANNFVDINPAPTAATAVHTLTGIHGMHSGQFTFSFNAGSETLKVEALDSSGNSLGPILVQNVSVVTIGATVAATVLAAGTYKILPPLAGAGLLFTKSGAVNTITLFGFISGAS